MLGGLEKKKVTRILLMKELSRSHRIKDKVRRYKFAKKKKKTNITKIRILL